ncbi:MAG: type II secretion system protein [Phycisphaerales bacterium]|nr:MAG: type II secretion system protein [Phycisphaerales bacterium]
MRRPAFTLVELLVSVAVIGLLMGLLFPALSAVKATARSVESLSNLRQMAIAANKYTTLWDVFPTALRYESVDGVAHRIAWDWVTTFQGQVISPGPLWDLTDNPDRVMQDPEYDGPANFNGDPFTGYNYNTTYIAGEAEYVAFGWDVVRKGVPPHACRRSDRSAIFGCGGWAGGANKFMRAPLNTESGPLEIVYAGGQAFRYRGCTNVAYIDGHVKSVCSPREGDLATEELLTGVMDFPHNGFLSDDDSAYDPR